MPKTHWLGLRMTVLAAAWLLLGLVAEPARADPAPEIAARAAAIEAALDDKRPEDAEVLAKAAIAAADETLPADDLQVANLHRLYGDALFYQDRIVEAEPHYRLALTIREKRLGMGAADTAVSADDLGIILKRQERFVEAEPYYREVIAIREAVGGPNDGKTAEAVFWLARLFDAAGRYADAAATMADAVARATIAYGPTDVATVQWQGERAAMLHDAGDLAAAEAAYLEAQALGASVFEADDQRLANVRQGLANLYMATERAAAAVPLYQQALAARDARLGPDDPASVNSANRLARALWATDDIAGAEPLFRRVLAARESSDGPDSLAAAEALRWIGRAAAELDRQAEAEIVFKRVLAIAEAKNPPGDVLTGFDLTALGQLYSGQQRFAEGRPLLERAVALFETSPENRSSAAAGRMALSFVEHATHNTPAAIALATQSLDDMTALKGAASREAADIELSIAGYRQDAGDLAEAERLVLAARDIYRSVAPDSRAMLRTTSELGRIRLAQGRLEDALALDREALEALTARYGADSPQLQSAIAEVGRALFAMGDYAGAADAFERSATMVEQLATIDADAAFASRTGDVEDQAIARAGVFDALVKSWYRLAVDAPDATADYAGRAFVVAQRVIESQAARALAQMAARQATGDGELAALVRERQDLVADWRRRDSALTLALTAATPDTASIAELRTMLGAADARIVAIDAKLATGFPAFATLQKPALKSIAEVQAALGDNEVLLFFADTTRLGPAGFETFVWVVPKTGAPRWRQLPRATGELSAAVRQLRTAMGVGASSRGPTPIAAAAKGDRASRVLTAASELHGALFGGIADMVAGKDLVIVPSKSLSALPFHALVSELPRTASADRFREARWLARDHAISILPSIAALIPAPTEPARQTGTHRAYLAFANPLLVGRNGDDRRAFDRFGCTTTAEPETIVAEAEMPALSSLFRGASADVAEVRALPPLPETTDEVCAIAAVLGTSGDSVHLGDGATETAVKSLSASGVLAAARVIHFATHGLIAGDLAGLAEPAIVLSPPLEATADDDGLLTASEVAALRLDADWVILSACNTAAGDGGGEALSGLARAFFYAGARALLVSHWPVNSGAAVRLTTGAVTALAADPSIGRAEALRRAMVAEIDRGGGSADPANWAPFILVGASH